MQHQYKMLRDVSRTFALSIEHLPTIVRDAITTAYLLLRVSDILEDHPDIPADRKARLLRLWVQVLSGQIPVNELTSRIADLDDSDPEVAVAQNAGQVIEALRQLPKTLQEALVTRINRTSLGMARWQEHGPFVEDEAALDDYMHQVAGRVGYLITDVFAWHSAEIAAQKEKLMPLSREYGLALQTVNVIRGVLSDYRRGWVFIPESFMAQVGLTRDTFLLPENGARALKIINTLANKADRHLRRGLDYIMAMPPDENEIRLACMWPLFFAVKTLAVSRDNINVIRNEVKMTRQDVENILQQTIAKGNSNEWLQEYYEQLANSV